MTAKLLSDAEVLERVAAQPATLIADLDALLQRTGARSAP